MGEKETARKKILCSWLLVCLYSILIFLSIPIANKIQSYISDRWGKNIFIYIVVLVLALGVVILVYISIFKRRVYTISNYIWLLLVIGGYAYFTFMLRKIPAEAIHFLEYGILGFLIFKALNHHIKDRSIFLTATALGLLIGTIDEILQWVAPQRIWNFHDLGINAVSVGLFQLAIWKVIMLKTVSGNINTRSIRILTSMFAVEVIIIGLCLSNTPERVASYTDLIPQLSFLQKEESMSEFGYKHDDPEIGTFYSRFTLKKLKEIDRNKWTDNAQILNDTANMNYRQFLKDFNPITNPFLHELRVHAYRRDAYIRKANKTQVIDAKKESYFIAFKENLILDRYFTQTMENSIYRRNRGEIENIERLIDKNKKYKSPVSSNLITNFSETEAWLVILFSLFLLTLLNILYREKPTQKNNSIRTTR